jgi:hypothetical protein
MGHDIDYDGHVDRWDRDEVAERAALEQELQEEEKQKKERSDEANAAEGKAPAQGLSGTGAKGGKPANANGKSGVENSGAVKGYVSPRKR